MLRTIPVFLGICLTANAQFSSLATPADGSRVYFATPLRQKNTNQNLYGKLFTFDLTGLSLFLSRDPQPPPPPASGNASFSNPYNFAGVTISSDGKTFAASATRDCLGPGEVCTRAERYITTISSGGQQKDYPGNLQLSANGNWAFGMGTSPPTPLFIANLVNVQTGEQTGFGNTVFRVSTSGRPVADDGTVVFSDFSSVVVAHGSDRRHVTSPTGDPVQEAVIDRSGATIVFGSNSALYLAGATGSGSSLLASDGFSPCLSDDGKTLLYLSNRTGSTQMRIARLGGSAPLDRQLGFETGGISAATLSGDGATVYVVTANGRLEKLSAATGAAQEWIARTPYLSTVNEFAPGKLVTIAGGGFADLSFLADPPLPESLNGVSVTIQGKRARILSVAPNAILAVVPPDVTPGDTAFATSPMDLSVASTSPFDPPHSDVHISAFSPELISSSGSGAGALLVAAHQDWSALVTPANPARPGEALHAYGVGLGATSPAVPYGAAAPGQEPFARLTVPFACGTANNTSVPVQVFYQGLAPNLAAVYQFDFLVPGDTPSGTFGIYCAQGGIGGLAISGSVPVTAR